MLSISTYTWSASYKIIRSPVFYYLCLHLAIGIVFAQTLHNNSTLVSICGLIGYLFLIKVDHKGNSKALCLSLIILHSIILLSTSYWLLYCLIDFLKVNMLAAYTVIIIGSVVLSLLFVLPGLLYHMQIKQFSIGFSLSLLMITIEYLRSHLFLAMPWLFSGNITANFSLFAFLLPRLGFWVVTYMMLRSIETIVNILHCRYDKDAYFLLPILLIAAMYFAIYTVRGEQAQPNSNAHAENKGLSINLLQLNHAHDTKTTLQEKWSNHMLMLYQTSKNALNITAEGVATIDQNDPIGLTKFKQFSVLKNTILGINFKEKDKFTPMLIGTNHVYGDYKKQHLVPFGEYFPLPKFIKKWFGFLQKKDLAIAKKPYDTKKSLISYNNYQLLPMICYDVFFPLTLTQRGQKADAIIVLAENTWYRNSVLQSMFWRVAKLRALESDKPVLLILNRGPSGHINPKGHVVQKSQYDEQTMLHTKLIKKNQSVSPWVPSGAIGIVLIWIIEGSILSLLYLKRRAHYGSNA